MKIKICSSELGVLFDDEAAKIEAIEQDDKILFVITDWDGKEREILSHNIYTVVKLGEAKENRVSGLLDTKGKPTSWDLASRYEDSIRILQEMGVDLEKLYFYLPREDGFVELHGPMPAAEARDICRKYWRVEG